MGGSVYRTGNRFAVTALTARTLGVCVDRSCQQQVTLDMTRRRFVWNLNESGLRLAGVGMSPPWGPPSATLFSSILATALAAAGARLWWSPVCVKGSFMEPSAGPTGHGRRRVASDMALDVESQDVDGGTVPLRQHQRPM